MKKLVFILSICFCSLAIHAQDDRDRALAYQYYRNGDFDKAIDLFEELYNDNSTIEYYQILFTSYKELKDYSAMEKLANKHSKKDRRVARCLVDLGYVYKLQDKAKKATELYDDIIKNLLPDENFISNTASYFQNYGELNYALQTYEKGSKLIRDPLRFSFEMASIYFAQSKNQEGINSLLDFLKYNPTEFDKVYSYIQTNQNKPEVFTELETQLYSRIQKNPNEDIYSEVLIWLKIQQKDFAGAFLYAKALDKRKNEEGDRIMPIAQQAFDEEDYDNAIKALEYLIQKGASSHLYIPSRMMLLNVRNTKITKGFNYTREDVQQLKNEYLVFISEYGKSPATAKTIGDLAKIEAFYLDELDSAIIRLNDVVNLIGLARDIKNRAKLDLGDYYVMSDEYWESTLLYSQVDKEDKDGIIGEEARFKNAKLSYYKGEFEWAQAQLDVLKGSTSELIANDALQLSVFIIDNTGMDTIYTPMEMFARADLLIFQNKFDQAITIMDSIPRLFANHSLSDDIFMAKAKIALKKLNYDEAITWLNYIAKSDEYKKDILGDDAIYMLANIYEKNKNDHAKAMEYYKAIMLDYKDSVYLTEARKKFRALRGDKLEED